MHQTTAGDLDFFGLVIPVLDIGVDCAADLAVARIIKGLGDRCFYKTHEGPVYRDTEGIIL